LGFFDRLREGLTRTKEQIVSRFEEIVQKADTAEQRVRPIDVDTIEALEELLISADVGIPATERIVTAVRGRAGRRRRDIFGNPPGRVRARYPARRGVSNAPAPAPNA